MSPRYRVLVIESDRAICALYEALLSRRGFVLEFAADPERAVECFLNCRYDAVLIEPAGHHGLDPAAVKLLQARGGEEFLVVTSAPPELLERLGPARFFSMIRKPFEIDQLCEQLRACCLMSEQRGRQFA